LNRPAAHGPRRTPAQVGARRCQVDVWEWGWLAELAGVLVLVLFPLLAVVALLSGRRGPSAGKGKAADPPMMEESDGPEAFCVDAWVPVTPETAASLRRLLDEGKDATVMVDPGPGVWTLDAALLAWRHRRAQEALADRTEELASIAGEDTGAVTVWSGQPPVATALDALRPAHCQPVRPFPARRDGWAWTGGAAVPGRQAASPVPRIRRG